jgi:hypothetical protein
MNEEIELYEGKKFFRESKKIDRTIEDLQKKIYKLKNNPQYVPLRRLLNRLKRLQIQFEEIEKSDRKSSKEEIHKLKEKHQDLLKIVNNNEVKRILKKLGLFILFGSATILIGDAINSISIHQHQAHDLQSHHHKGLEATNVIYEVPDKNYNITSPRIMVADVCAKEHVPFDLIAGIIKKESEWNPNSLGKNATSHDIGLMQLNSRYLAWFEEKFWNSKEKFDVNNPQDNITIGVRYFKWLLKLFHNDTSKALMAYNAGPTAVMNNKIPKASIAYAKSILKSLEQKTV